MYTHNRVRILAIAGILAIVITIVFLAWANIGHFQEATVAKAQQQLILVAKLKAEEARTYILDHQHDLEMLAGDPRIIKAILSDESAQDILKTDGYSHELAVYSKILHNSVNGLYRLDAKGILQSRVPFVQGRVGVDFSNKPGVKAIIKTHEPYLSEVFSAHSGNKCISICYPIFNGKEFVGILRTMVHLDTINKMVAGIEIGWKGYVHIFDNDGTTIAHPNYSFLSKNVIIEREKAYPDHDWSDLKAIISRMAKGEEGVGTYHSMWWNEKKPEFVKKVTAFVPVKMPGRSWSVGITVGYDEIIRPVQAYARNVSFAAGALIIIFIGASIGFYYTRKKKIQLQAKAESADELRNKNEQLQIQIAERKKTEEALRESEKKYRMLFEQSADATLIIEEDEFIDCNQATVEMLGYSSKKKLLRTHPSQLSPKLQPDGRSSFEKANEMMSVAFERGSHRFEWAHKRCNGEVFPVEVLLTAVTLADRKFIHVVWRDITDRKQAEDQREELVKTLKYKNRELQDIVYIASHDLRSPLVNIEGFSSELKSDCDHLMELLTEQAEGGDKRKQIGPLIKEYMPQSLGFILASAKKMSSLLDGLLQVSRVGSVKIKSESLDINKVVGETLASMAHQIKKNNVAVNVDSLPGCTGDTHMLDHVFTNLISNAVKYLDPSKEGEIRITGKVDRGMSIYCVEDNGIGIAPEHQKKVFKMFHRVKPESSVSGEGLGLTVVTRAVDRLGGKIWLESEPGKGSKFFIALPND